MNKITLQAEDTINVTLIPNTFIDQYMPSANGAYVKVYLYLLRCLQANFNDISISSIADHLENTEKDILRALNYWEKLQLLTLTRNHNKEIIGIQLINLTHTTNKSVATYNEHEEIAVSLVDPQDIPSTNQGLSPQGIDLDSLSNEALITKTYDVILQKEDSATKHNSNTKKPERQAYSAEKTAQLTSNEEIKWIMHIVEIYLDRPLKPMDIQLILYLYEELHFSAELIMYLYEYCVSKGKKNVSYIEAVALTWAEEGIDTEEKAKEATETFNEHFNTVNKAFGLNRAPGQIERQYIAKWVDMFGFTDEIITEACNRTILRTQKPDFKYTDKILETWYKKGAKNKSDIARLDEEFSKGNKTKEATNKVNPISKPSSNKFNQFPQRTYTAQDYADLERKLLNKGL